jgi:hypothetical protein
VHEPDEYSVDIADETHGLVGDSLHEHERVGGSPYGLLEPILLCHKYRPPGCSKGSRSAEFRDDRVTRAVARKLIID